MSDTRPIWFLDVDGVINAIVYSCPEGFQEGYASPGDGTGRFPIKWNPDVIEMINRVHDEGIARVMWLTTWGSSANGELRELVGLNEFEVAAEPPSHGGEGPSWWKFDVVQKYYADNPRRRYVWTDDDLLIEKAARDWVIGKSFFTIAPFPHVTLSTQQISNIEKFCLGAYNDL